MELALTREVSPRIARCELTFIERQPIDYRRAVVQHTLYCETLEGMGLEVLRVPADPDCPDCCFVEDTAVVLDEVAVLANLGSAARRPESPAIEAALTPHRKIIRMAPPATLDGGDVLALGRTLCVGLSKRTNAEGAEALRRAVSPFGYTVAVVEVRGCLHLKSAITALDDETLLANVACVDPHSFRDFEVVSVPMQEPWAANVLQAGDTILVHAGFPRTIDLIAKRGLAFRTVDVSEFLKAEAGVTCKSILFRRS